MNFRSLKGYGRNRPRDAGREPDMTSLINIVFLILIFFIVAGTLRPFSARDIKLAKVEKQAVATATPSSLIVHWDGRIRYAGKDVPLPGLAVMISAAKSIEHNKPFTIVADGRVAGHVVLEVSRALRSAGIKEVAVMIERGRK